MNFFEAIAEIYKGKVLVKTNWKHSDGTYKRYLKIVEKPLVICGKPTSIPSVGYFDSFESIDLLGLEDFDAGDYSDNWLVVTE